MLILDLRQIGNNLLAARRARGLTQAEVAELAGLSDRTYADIERGTVNMRIETALRICGALHITPDMILTAETPEPDSAQGDLLSRLEQCSTEQRRTAMKLVEVYLNSLSK